MTKEKQEAERIFNMYYDWAYDTPTTIENEEEVGRESQKQCAILHVEGLIKEYNLIAPEYSRKKYWNDVKQILEEK